MFNNQKKLVDAEKKSEKQSYKKEVNPVIEAAEKDGLSMAYHSILFLLKIFLIFRTIMNFACTFANEASIYQTVDQIFYVVMTIVLVLSLWKQNHKQGVIWLFVYMALELGMNFAVYYIAQVKGLDIPSLGTKMFGWVIGSLVWAVPTFIYYRKRWRYML